MPSWAKDEDIWTKAKKAASKTYDKDSDPFYPVTTSIYKKMGGEIAPKKKKETAPVIQPGNPSGLKVNYWFWADKDRPAPQPDKAMKDQTKAEPEVTLSDDQKAVLDLLVQNPGMSASTFYNLLKSKGFQISHITDVSPPIVKVEKSEEKKEADSGSTAVAVTRADKKESVKIIDRYCGGLHFKLKEANAKDDGIGPTRFEVVLLQEGLGNLKDCFYYTKEALQSAVPIFEGKKFFADHPDGIEEQTRPERSVRDVCGYFENLRLEEGDDKRSMLVGDVVTFPDMPYQWVRGLLREAVKFQQKHADKDLVGLSINASGDAKETAISDFMEATEIPPSILPKLKQAMEQGVDTVRLVTMLTDAVSCDLVTEAGAGGKVLEMIEKEKLPMAKKEAEAKEAEKKEMEKKEDEAKAKQAEGEVDGEKHDDEAQDKELIKKMLKKHMGLGDDEEVDEADMQAAMEAYEFMKSDDKDMDDEGAAKHAAKALKCAKHMAAKHAEAKESEKKEDEAKKENECGEKKESEKKEDEAKKESSADLKLAGRVAFLEAELKKRDLHDYLDEKLADSKLPMSATRAFRESLGKELKSKKEIDEKFTVFLEGYRRQDEGFLISSEKTGFAGTKAVGFEDCVD